MQERRSLREGIISRASRFFQIVDIGATVLEIFVVHDAGLQLHVGFDTVDNQLLQRFFSRAQSPAIAVLTVADQFADHGIVIWHGIAGVNVRFPMSWSTSAQMAEKLLTGSGSAASSRHRYRIHKSMYPDRHGHQRDISPRLTDRTFSLVMVFPGDRRQPVIFKNF
jgi:hypothetical protein